jgi:E3 ubiquitin-protein ligase RNF115/126
MNSIKDTNNQIYSMTKTYWCHLCKTEFMKLYISGVEVQCRICSNTFCEEIVTEQSSSDHPSTFEPFEIVNPLTRNNLNQNNRLPVRGRFSLLHLLLSNLELNNILNSNNSLDLEEDNHLDNILNYLIANDLNRYGNPPASKKAVNSLESIEINEEKLIELKKNNLLECSVCKDEFEIKQIIKKIPCKHHFHSECIMPWFKNRNSCPVCRFELPTDDEDYENSKIKKEI